MQFSCFLLLPLIYWMRVSRSFCVDVGWVNAVGMSGEQITGPVCRVLPSCELQRAQQPTVLEGDWILSRSSSLPHCSQVTELNFQLRRANVIRTKMIHHSCLQLIIGDLTALFTLTLKWPVVIVWSMEAHVNMIKINFWRKEWTGRGNTVWETNVWRQEGISSLRAKASAESTYECDLKAVAVGDEEWPLGFKVEFGRHSCVMNIEDRKWV